MKINMGYKPFKCVVKQVPGIGKWEQKLYRFKNGYGVSVARHKGTYGFEKGLWELAVIKFNEQGKDDWELCYDTDITGDVVGSLTEVEIEEILAKLEFYPL